MDKSLLRAVQHLALDSSPVSKSELRELTLRHLLAEPDNHRNKFTTANLFDAYLNLTYESGDTSNDNIIWFDNKLQLQEHFERLYMEGFDYGRESAVSSVKPASKVPGALPMSYEGFPRDIFEQFAAILGYKAANKG